jgi:hypothetical protein
MQHLYLKLALLYLLLAIVFFYLHLQGKVMDSKLTDTYNELGSVTNASEIGESLETGSIEASFQEGREEI